MPTCILLVKFAFALLINSNYVTYIAAFRLSITKVRIQQSSTHLQATQKSDDEFFNEAADLAGEPKWFKRGESTGEQYMTELITPDNMIEKTAKNGEIRNLPLFFYEDGQAFPTGRIPFHIFEMRYRSMMNDIQTTDKMFGVVMSEKGQFCEVGTAVENFDRELFTDGRQFVDNICRQRFRILKIVQEKPYMIAEVQYGFSDAEIVKAGLENGDLPDKILNLEKECYQTLQDVITLTNKLYEEEDANVPIIMKQNEDGSEFKPKKKVPVLSASNPVKLLNPGKHMFRVQVASDFSFALSDMIGGSSRLKQLLLESEKLEDRLNMIKKALTNARSYLLNEMDPVDEPFN
jgi:Lon protease-like protein